MLAQRRISPSLRASRLRQAAWRQIDGAGLVCHSYQCREKFTVRTGTLYERSHIPLHKWLLATHLLTSSEKGHFGASVTLPHNARVRLVSYRLVHGASYPRGYEKRQSCAHGRQGSHRKSMKISSAGKAEWYRKPKRPTGIRMRFLPSLNAAVRRARSMSRTSRKRTFYQSSAPTLTAKATS